MENQDQTGWWVDGTAHLEAHWQDSDNHLVESKTSPTGYEIVYQARRYPTFVEISYYTGRGEEAAARAKELASRFPKSAGVKTNRLAVTGPAGRRHESDWIQAGQSPEMALVHFLYGRVSLIPDRSTGWVNETGVRRYRQMVATFGKLGIPVEVPARYAQMVGNAYKSRQEFEAALVKHLEESLEESAPSI